MRPLLLMTTLGLLVGFAEGRQDEKKEPGKAGLTVGQDLPAPINPYNATGMAKSRFHDPIGPHDLDPFVLVFTGDTEFTKDLKDLLAFVENAIDKNPNVRLASAVVFFSTNVKDVVADDDARDALAEKLTTLANDLKLKHVVLAIDSPNNVPKYPEVMTGTRAVVLNKLRVGGVFGGDKFDAAALAQLDLFLTEKLGAKRK